MPLALTAFLATIFCMVNGRLHPSIFEYIHVLEFLADLFMSLAMVKEIPEGDVMTQPPSIRSKDHLPNLKLLLHAYMFVGN